MRTTLARAHWLFWVCAIVFTPGPGYADEKITFTPKENRQYQAKPEGCAIEVFADAKPEQPYVEIGVVNYHDERHRTNAGSLKIEVAMPKIKARACKAGGDALIDVRVTEVRRLEFAMFNVRASVVRFEPK